MKHSPTPSQQAAIDAGGNVLVSAGAGTGKTRTLVARALRLVFEEGCDIDRILMVTFTEAAAAEMRQRLREALQERQADAADAADADRAAGQLARLDIAPIGTLHSFCLRLIREHFHDLDGVDPQVRVLDPAQTRPIQATVLEGLLEGHYAGDGDADKRVRHFIRRECGGSDEAVRELVLRLHTYAQTQPDPAGWMQEQQQRLEGAEPVVWRRWLKEEVEQWRKLWGERLREVSAAQPCYGVFAGILDGLTAEPTPAEMNAALKKIKAANQTKAKGGAWPNGQKGVLSKPCKVFFDEAEAFRSLAFPDEGTDLLKEDWQQIREPAATLLELACGFTRQFTRAKREAGGVDFADLEQCALQLLRRPEIAALWRCRFEHVFVDEYQDINAAQDAILAGLSREGTSGNRFLVGDLKQSIYRFRLADPRIFQRYEREWNGAAGRCLPLSDSFRSRAPVLDFVNALFGELMRPVMGGMRYSEATRLRCGLTQPPEPAQAAGLGNPPCVELHLISRPAQAVPHASDDGDDDEAIDRTEREARLIARRLRQLREEKRPVWNGREMKAVDWGDMAVLLRAPRLAAEMYAKVFHQCGIPLVAPRGGFYEAIEVMDLLNLLRLLDNPLQDVPLLAVLRSPLAGWSLDELAQIRAARADGLFWDALRQFHRTAARNTDAWRKADEFFTRYTGWRGIVRRHSLSACLESVLDETGYEALLLAGELGEARVGNIRRLLASARQFDPYQRQGLHRFLRFVEQQEESEAERRTAPAAGTAEAVRLMSIHQSKGLEFPVVVLADLAHQFNEQDLRKNILLSDQWGLCLKAFPPGGEQRYETLPLFLARRRERGELRSEELRLLYVALTRARDTLLLVGTDTKAPPEPGRLELDPLNDITLLEQQNYLGWFKLWLPELVRAQAGDAAGEGQNDLVRWILYEANDARLARPADAEPPHTAVAAISEPPVPEEGVEAALQKWRERLAWQYPYEETRSIPAKTSATALRRQQADEEAATPKFAAVKHGFQEGPAADDCTGLSAAQKGTAHHRFLQHVALDCAGSDAGLRAEAERLRAAGLLSPKEHEALEMGALVRFWEGELGRQIRAEAVAVRRELPFTARFWLTELASLGLPAGAGAADDFVVVQGVADLVVLRPEEIWLLDFKTDAVEAATLPAKVKQYTLQLRLYAKALEKIHRRPVTRRWLHFLAMNETAAV